MAIVTSLVAVVCGGLVVRFVFREIDSLPTRIVDKLIRTATSRLPEDQRLRFDEEWRSHVNDVPRSLGKIYVAAGFVIAARKLVSSRLNEPGPIIRFQPSERNEGFHFEIAPCCARVSSEEIVVVIDSVALNKSADEVTFVSGTIHYTSCQEFGYISHCCVQLRARSTAELAILEDYMGSSRLANWV